MEALESFYNNDPFDLLPIYQDLYEATNETWFKDTISKLCAANNLCPLCFSRCFLPIKRQFQGECRGEPAYEEITHRYCVNCGWSE